MKVISAVLQAKPNREAELERLLLSLFPLVKTESGVIEYVLHRAENNPGKFFFYEKYKDQSAIDFHLTTSYLKEAFAKYDDLLSQKPEVEFYEDIATIK